MMKDNENYMRNYMSVENMGSYFLNIYFNNKLYTLNNIIYEYMLFGDQLSKGEHL